VYHLDFICNTYFPSQIHRHLIQVYGDGVTRLQCVRKECRAEFDNGGTDILSDDHTHRPNMSMMDVNLA
jgi:hypothetical protein